MKRFDLRFCDGEARARPRPDLRHRDEEALEWGSTNATKLTSAGSTNIAMAPPARTTPENLALAWDALIYDRFGFRSGVQERAWNGLVGYARDTGRTAISLSSPQQTKTIAACADIAGIPYDESQTEIPIPQSVLNRTNLLIEEARRATQPKHLQYTKRRG